MGAVHVETLHENRGVHEYENITLGEVRIIKTLIKNRAEIDTFYEAKLYECIHPLGANEVPIFHELIEVIYLDLERLIDRCKFNKKQFYVVNMLMRGYSEYDISEKFNCDESTINRLLESICERIKEQNDIEWVDWTETSGLVRTKYIYKQCKKCGKWLRAVDKYFSPQKKGKYGLRSVCRDCR